MYGGLKLAQKARYYSSVMGIYLLTLLFAWYAFSPSWLSHTKVVALPATPPPPPAVKVTTGLPVRIVLPTLDLDLPVDPGVYNPVDHSWNLAGLRAQFALISALANDYGGGDTFLYGHNNKHVFGHLVNLQPGDQALLYTDNGHVFSYTYDSLITTQPDDTSIFTYKGPTIMTIQTCSGNWFELRQLYKFRFDKLVQ